MSGHRARKQKGHMHHTHHHPLSRTTLARAALTAAVALAALACAAPALAAGGVQVWQGKDMAAASWQGEAQLTGNYVAWTQKDGLIGAGGYQYLSIKRSRTSAT
jgi:hypothetical protein